MIFFIICCLTFDCRVCILYLQLNKKRERDMRKENAIYFVSMIVTIGLAIVFIIDAWNQSTPGLY